MDDRRSFEYQDVRNVRSVEQQIAAQGRSLLLELTHALMRSKGGVTAIDLAQAHTYAYLACMHHADGAWAVGRATGILFRLRDPESTLRIDVAPPLN